MKEIANDRYKENDMLRQEDHDALQRFEMAVDEDVMRFLESVYSGGEEKSVTVGFLTEEASKQIEALTGKVVKGNRIILDANAALHIKRRHGENGEQDSSMKDERDIARIGYVLANYDSIDFYHEYAAGYVDADGKLAPKIVISKRINGTFYVVEAVSDAKKKRNYIVTAYIVPRDKRNDSSVPDNALAPGSRPQRS